MANFWVGEEAGNGRGSSEDPPAESFITKLKSQQLASSLLFFLYLLLNDKCSYFYFIYWNVLVLFLCSFPVMYCKNITSWDIQGGI